MVFNRKERLQIAKKISGGGKKRPSNKNVNWRLLNSEKRRQREQKVIEELEERNNTSLQDDGKPKMMEHYFGRQHSPPTTAPSAAGKQKTWYSISVALPGSILNNVQTHELKTYITGELARTFTIFCVDEVVVFDETARITGTQIDAYYNGNWTGEEQLNSSNVECIFYMARILEFLECPQYLRKALFPLQRPLKFSALLNPINAMHHLLSTDLDSPFREGIVLDRPIKKGLLCDVGLEKELILETSDHIPPFTRVTVRIESQQQSSKRLHGSLVSSRTVRDESGVYWGYSVRIAKSLSEVLNHSYDIVVGTSERGMPIAEFPVSTKPDKICKILVVFGGLNGLEAALEFDQSIQETDAAKYFPNYVNCLPDQGSRVIRTEEAIPITLTALKCKLDWAC